MELLIIHLVDGLYGQSETVVVHWRDDPGVQPQTHRMSGFPAGKICEELRFQLRQALLKIKIGHAELIYRDKK